MTVRLKKLHTQNTGFQKIQVLIVLISLHVWYWYMFNNFFKILQVFHLLYNSTLTLNQHKIIWKLFEFQKPFLKLFQVKSVDRPVDDAHCRPKRSAGRFTNESTPRGGVNRCMANLLTNDAELKINCNTLSITKESNQIPSEGLWTNSFKFL